MFKKHCVNKLENMYSLIDNKYGLLVPDVPENLMITKFHITDIFKIMMAMFIILIVVIASQVYKNMSKCIKFTISMCLYIYIHYIYNEILPQQSYKKSIPSNNNHQKILDYHESLWFFKSSYRKMSLF